MSDEHDPETKLAFTELCAEIPPSDLLVLDAHFDPMIAQFESQGEKGVVALLYLSMKIAAKFT